MAAIYESPITPPDWKEYSVGDDFYNHEKAHEIDNAYLDKVRTWLKDNGYTAKFVGELLYFPIADGHATYMVAKLKPPILIHIPLGDAWQIPEAHARGLRSSDIEKQLENRKLLGGRTK